MAINITDAQGRVEKRAGQGSQDTTIPRKVFYIAGAALAIIVVLRLGLGDSAYA